MTEFRELWTSFCELDYRRYVISALIVFLSSFLLVELSLLVVEGVSIPSKEMCGKLAYLIANMSVFFLLLAFLVACSYRVHPLCIRALIKTVIFYVIPMTALQLLYASASDMWLSALEHGVYMVGLTMLIWSVYSLLGSLSMSFDLRKIAVLLIFASMFFNVVLFNEIIENSGDSRPRVINAVLYSNPAIATSFAYDRDILHGQVLYERSVIGQYYYYKYPSVWLSALYHLIAAVLIGMLSVVLTMLKPRREKDEEAEEDEPDKPASTEEEEQGEASAETTSASG
ncbi:MAG: hypothetical protein U5N86_03665 [Planctomycetota bacterium]|nr:hypothetical protein [Planctomycetota bacterium]